MRTGQARKPSKYRATPTVVDNIRFHSAKEARRYQELKLLEKAGEITHVILQPRYGLYVKPFLRADMDRAELVKIGDYVADFQYFERGEKVIEDTKGFRTDVYRLKKKFVEALYGIQIREI